MSYNTSNPTEFANMMDASDNAHQSKHAHNFSGGPNMKFYKPPM